MAFEQALGLRPQELPCFGQGDAAAMTVQQRRTRAAIESGRVLVDMLQLARAHGDERYASAQGMISAVYGADAEAAL